MNKLKILGSSYQIQKLSIQHVDEITSIISNAMKKDSPHYKKETNRAHLHIFDKEFFIEFLKDKKNAVLGAFSKNNLVGVVVLKADFGGVIFIYWLVVKREFRQKGVGTFLLEEAEKWALQNKYHYTYLFTQTDKNIDFYKKRGFRYIGKHPNSWFGETEHELGKNLRNKPFQEAFIK